ncbi:MAG: hypothetical protein A3B47_04770 [Candidatus Levybacteria bacterium RIFCSPLOWO2_01_FULL_39_24]|nr:MAG: hypothetical protein A2800_04140 [Candidatus Levybacteria bacterium RIFCSPHIGHO2_01_FULL_40_16]OGH28001.1 MAG: hypothetical protein A3E12_02525 [Candidatus Levybacteria bacterium RIFCSPHIGHO2_12_FULL_39_9]OGH46797.1 MAG: hypothetical protein A3B47_04770 [Candidatus Levybacteria bacterium RIFCSPLOWO2_01_FULL_39_24]
MAPAFKTGDTILANRLSYFLSKPKIGDVVVLKKGRFIIKRIAKVEKGKIFVIGDNEKESTDSRNFGWINMREVVGKVILRI